jgi:acetyl esterase/lipase
VETVEFDGVNRLPMDIYYPSSASMPNGKPKGIMFYVHGGAWISGSRRTLHAAARRAYREGWIMVSPEYRLSGYDLSGAVKHPFPAALHDVKRAIRHAKYHLTEVRPKMDARTPFVGMGHSAGGHLVGLAAVSAGGAGLEPPDLTAAQLRYDAKLLGVVPIAAPLDLHAIITKGASIPRDDLTEWFWYNILGTRDAITAFLNCPVRGDVGSCLCDARLRPGRCGAGDLVRAASLHTHYDLGDPPFHVSFAEKDYLSVAPIAGCELGVKYLEAGRPLHYWADVVECAPTSASNSQACTDHDLLDMNAAVLDWWLGALTTGSLPPNVPADYQPQPAIENLCAYP